MSDSTHDTSSRLPTPLAQVSDRRFFAFNAVVSVAALSFLSWLLLLRGGGADRQALDFLPAVNAGFNSLAALFLIAGYFAILKRKRHLHQYLMVAAFAASSLFLISYLIYHYTHGDTKYVGAYRGTYLSILASHVVLSATIVPLALTTFYFAWKGALVRHRKIAKITLPIWLYVSVTGVVIYFMNHYRR